MSCEPFTFTRPWPRTDNICEDLPSGVTQHDIDMRRKAETLRHKNNGTKLTKRQQYAQVVKGCSNHRKTSWSTQSFGPCPTTNPNVQNLPRIDNTLLCDVSPSNIFTHSSSSDVPGNTMLTFNMSIPLRRYRVRQTY